MDVLRAIKIYHIYIGQKIRLLDWLLVLFGGNKTTLPLWSYLCTGDAPKAQREDFPTRSVRAQFPQVDRQTDMKQVLQLTRWTLLCVFCKCWTECALLNRCPSHTMYFFFHSSSSYMVLCLITLFRIGVEFCFSSDIFLMTCARPPFSFKGKNNFSGKFVVCSSIFWSLFREVGWYLDMKKLEHSCSVNHFCL